MAKSREEQLALFAAAAPLPPAASPGDRVQVRPEHTPVPAEMAEPPVPAPVEALRALDAELDAVGPPPARLARAPAACPRGRAPPPPVEAHDGLDELRHKMREIEERGAGGRLEAPRPVLPTVVADHRRASHRAELIKAAGLAGEQKDIVRRLDRHGLLDDRTWLDLLIDACSTELNGDVGLAELLKASLQRGRLAPLAMLARSRFFWTLRRLTSASYPEIAQAWGVRDHNLPKYGHDAHARRFGVDAAAPPSAPSVERTAEEGPAPKPPPAARWVERDTEPPLAELPARARAS